MIGFHITTACTKFNLSFLSHPHISQAISDLHGGTLAYLYPSFASSKASCLNSSYIFLLKWSRRKNDQNLKSVFISWDCPMPSRFRSVQRKDVDYKNWVIHETLVNACAPPHGCLTIHIQWKYFCIMKTGFFQFHSQNQAPPHPLFFSISNYLCLSPTVCPVSYCFEAKYINIGLVYNRLTVLYLFMNKSNFKSKLSDNWICKPTDVSKKKKLS